jgi:uncharacterized protein YndB with AHSA1/START domain
MTFNPTPLAPVDREAQDGRWTLVFVREFRHPPEKVWAALTDPDQLDAWSPFRSDRSLATTGPATLTMVDGDEEVPLAANVLRAEPPALLEYTWDEDRLRWELTATDGGTRLVLHHTVQAEGWIPKVAAGWHLCFDVAEHLLDGDPVPVVRGQAAMAHGWHDLHDAYAAKLGIDTTADEPEH